MEQPTPWSPTRMVSPGLAVCDLAGYVMSLSSGVTALTDQDNPIGLTHEFASLFRELLLGGREAAEDFETPKMNLLTKAGGALAVNQFFADYPEWSKSSLDNLPFYKPADLAKDPNYFGLSGGGGNGMGGEIVTEEGVTTISFGGGGGAGFYSNTSSSYVGGGGGGGAQLTNGTIDGLGVGAGTSYREGPAQMTYNTYCGGPGPGNVDAIVADYSTELDAAFALLSDGRFILRGGGGMGSGYEYLKKDGVQEWIPHAMSTGASFSFAYTFETGSAARFPPPKYPTSRQVIDLYQQYGNIMGTCGRRAPKECPGGYDNYACTCQAQFNCTISAVEKIVSDPAEIPRWVRLNTCPGGKTSNAPGPAPGPGSSPNPCTTT